MFQIKNNLMLTEEDYAFLVTCPLFETSSDEKSLTEEVCNYIKNKKELIPKNELHKVTLGTYLNIVEYIKKKQTKRIYRGDKYDYYINGSNG